MYISSYIECYFLYLLSFPALPLYLLLGAPLVYYLDENLRPIPQPDAIAPLQGKYLGDLEGIKARIEGVKNQTKK